MTDMRNDTADINTYATAAANLWKLSLAGAKEHQKKASERVRKTHMEFVANLYCYGAAHFTADGDINAPKYTEKLARAFQVFLTEKVGMESEKQRNKYSSVITASLFIRKSKCDRLMQGMRNVAVSDGPDGVIAFLDKLGPDESGVRSWNQFVARVQPGASVDTVEQLIKRVAGLTDEHRDVFFSKIKAAIAAKKKEEAEKNPAGKAKGATAKVQAATAA
jgi:hypothetical protein